MKFVQHEDLVPDVHPRETVLNPDGVLWFRQIGNVTNIYSRENHLCHAFVNHTEVADALKNHGMELTFIETPDCTYYFNQKAVVSVKPEKLTDNVRITFNRVMNNENIAVEMVLPVSAATYATNLKRYQLAEAEHHMPSPGC